MVAICLSNFSFCLCIFPLNLLFVFFYCSQNLRELFWLLCLVIHISISSGSVIGALLASYGGVIFPWIFVTLESLYWYLCTSVIGFLFHTWQVCFGTDNSSRVNSVWVSGCVHWKCLCHAESLLWSILGKATVWTMKMGITMLAIGWEWLDRIADLLLKWAWESAIAWILWSGLLDVLSWVLCSIVNGAMNLLSFLDRAIAQDPGTI